MNTTILGAQYEERVANLIRELQECGAPLKDVNWGRCCRMRGASGVHHQVDVSFLDGRTLVLMECKRLSRAPGLDEIRGLKATRDDIAAVRARASNVLAILVSVAPPGPATRQFAAYYGIRCCVVSEGMPFAFHYGSHGLIGVDDSGRGVDSIRIERSSP